PECPEDGESFVEDRASSVRVETERGELATYSFLGIALARAQNRPAPRDDVECRPLERKVERVAGRGDHARRAQPHTRGALRDRRQQRDRLVPRLRKQAVAYPHRVEPGLLHRFGEVEQLAIKLSKLLVSRRFEQMRVKGGVRLEELLDLSSLGIPAHRRNQPFERREILLAESRDRKPDRHHLERLAHLVQLEKLLLGEQPHDGATPRPYRDEALGRKPADRLTDRTPAHAELLGERYFLQLGARLQAF